MAETADFRAAAEAKREGVLRTLASVLLDRFRFGQMAGFTFGGRRNTYQIFGYPQVITAWDYREKYARGGIAKAIVEAYPEATWRGGVELYEDEDPKVDTEFEKAFKDLDARLNFWQRCQQVDIVSGLSTFGVLLIGAEGKVAEELPKGGPVKFLKPYSGGGGGSLMDSNRNQAGQDSSFQCAARVMEYDADQASERFGEPTFYSIRVPNGLGYTLAKVHWSRVIHVAEGCLEDDVYGIPVLESVFNLLLDLEKVTGGGSESFFLRANQGLHVNVDKDMGLPGTPSAGQGLTPEQRADMKDKFEELQHQLQRVVVTRGVDVTQLGSDVANFSLPADAILKQIAGSKKIPMRILTGSEMGTLASEQDAANFDSRVNDRRTGYAGPKIVRRAIDRLIKYEMLPTPKQYTVGWPVEENMDEKGKAGFALALAQVNQTQGSIVFPDDEIRDMAFNKPPLTDTEKKAIADEKAQKAADAEPDVDPLAAQLKALEAAIEADDLQAIGRIIGLQEAPQKFASTQVQLPQDLADAVLDLSASIPDGDLWEPEGGREDDLHVTVRYGLVDPNPGKLRAVLAGRASVPVTLGRTGFFEASDYDVVWVGVDSPGLVALSKLILNQMECVSSDHGEYLPHVTIAYVRKGRGAAYAGSAALEGRSFVARFVTLSQVDGTRTEAPLG